MGKRFDFLTASTALGLAFYTAILLASMAPHSGFTSACICNTAVVAAALIGIGLLLFENVRRAISKNK